MQTSKTLEWYAERLDEALDKNQELRDDLLCVIKDGDKAYQALYDKLLAAEERIEDLRFELMDRDSRDY